MRSGTFILFFLFFAGCHGLSAEPSIPQKEITHTRLRILSASNLNISTQKPCDSLILLGRRAETAARKSGNIGSEFKAGQIQVNAYAMSGNLALAVSKAQNLLDKAHIQDNPLATGLALQAIGDTYMFSGRLEQADSVFSDAAKYIIKHGDLSMQAELRFQHLHTYLYLSEMGKAAHEIKELHDLLPHITGAERATYDFLLTSYNAYVAIYSNDRQKAEKLLQALEQQPGVHSNLWLHNLKSQYYLLTEDYDKSLAYSDSALMIARQGTNGNTLRQTLISKATLLEKMDRMAEADSLYKNIYMAIDSIYKSQYISQIDSLHVTYWIDQQHTANIIKRNKLYAKLIGGLFALSMITVVVIILVRRKNQELVRSRHKLEKLRKESDDALRTKSLFLSNMSHELRTPLNAITGFASILTDEPDIDDETRHQCSDYIRQNADLLLKLINDVVDIAELKDDTIRFSFAPCEVVALCRNVFKTVENVKRTEAQLQFVTDLQQLEIVTDKDRLQQVLINLLINATKFTKSGTITLRLTLNADHNEAEFSVEDTGCGIPAEKQPLIFERFEKLHEEIQGAGLGLSICKLIIDHTGGRIWVDPAYTAGARFVFTHPLTLKEPKA